MNSATREYLRVLMAEAEARMAPAYGIVIDLKSRKERREARARERSKRLAQLSGRREEKRPESEEE